MKGKLSYLLDHNRAENTGSKKKGSLAGLGQDKMSRSYLWIYEWLPDYTQSAPDNPKYPMDLFIRLPMQKAHEQERWCPPSCNIGFRWVIDSTLNIIFALNYSR